MTLLAFGQNKKSASGSELWLHELDVKKMETGWSTSKANKSIDGVPLSVGGKKFQKGVGTHAVSKILLELNKSAFSFTAFVGVDDEAKPNGSVEFFSTGQILTERFFNDKHLP